MGTTFYGCLMKGISHTDVLTCLTSDSQALVNRGPAVHAYALRSLARKAREEMFNPQSWHQKENLMTLAADRLGTVIFVVLLQMDFPRGMGLTGKVEGCAWRHLVT